MIDITGLREDKRPQSSIVVRAILDRLEEAESECLEQARLNGMGSEREAALMAKLEAAEKDAALKEKVIDSLAAVVKRLDAQCDAAERERDECNRRRLEAADHFAAQTALMKKKYDDLRVRIEAMVRQEPVAWARKLGLDVPSFGCVTDLKYRPSNIPESSYIPLYALPGAQTQPTPSIPEGWKLVPIEPTLSMCIQGDNARENIDDGTRTPAIYRAMLAAAPEAKP